MIEEIRKPTLLPLGAEEEIIIKTKNMFSCDYYIGDDCYVSYKQGLLDGDIGKFDGDDAVITEIIIGNYKGRLFVYDQEKYIVIVWSDDVYSYNMFSEFMSAEELISVAESVK